MKAIRYFLVLFALAFAAPPCTAQTFLGTYGGHDYYLTSSGSVHNAEAEAADLGNLLGRTAYLVVLGSAAEDDWLGTVATGWLWIGLNDLAQEGTFQWVNGEPVNYTNWFPGEPSGCGAPAGTECPALMSKERYVQTHHHLNVFWNDLSDLNTATYAPGVIEVEAATTAVSVTLVEAKVVSAGVRLRWAVPSVSTMVSATVQRRTERTAWVDLAGPFILNESSFTYQDQSISTGERYGYRLSLRDDQEGWYSDEAWVLIPIGSGTPRVLTFGTPRPSPSDGNVRFAIGLPNAGHMRLRVFDVMGRQVATVTDRDGASGWFELGWDGRDASAHAVSGGVYWARLEYAGQVITRKVVIAR